MKLNNKIYDVLKWVCLIFLPALIVAYVSLDGAFGIGYADKVTTVVATVQTFLGALIGVSTAEYNKEKEQ